MDGGTILSFGILVVFAGFILLNVRRKAGESSHDRDRRGGGGCCH
jgi:hypothetical protein